MIIMSNFYKTISEKTDDSSTALQKAQLDLFNRAGKDLPLLFSHPYFGRSLRPLGTGSRQNWWMLNRNEIIYINIAGI